jgi:hypothetical protein
MHINYNMNNRLFFALLSVLLVAGCSSENRRMKTPTGFEYQIVRKGPSKEPIGINSYIFFNMALTEKDSVLQSTASTGKPSVMKVTEDTKNFGQLKPLVDLMATLHEGDSMLFFFPIDSFERKPPGFENLQNHWFTILGSLMSWMKLNLKFMQIPSRRNRKRSGLW